MATTASRARLAAPSRRVALAAVVLAVVGWSASTLFVRAAHANAIVYTTWRLWFALPLLAGIVVWRRGGIGLWRRGAGGRASSRHDGSNAGTDRVPPLWPEGMSRARWVAVFGLGGAVFAVGAATTFAAIGMTRLVDVTLIGSLQPVLIMVFAVVAWSEYVARRQVGLATVAVLGTALVAFAGSGGGGTWSLGGDLMAAVSLVANAAWFLYGRWLRSRFAIDPFVFLLNVFTAAAVLLTVASLVATGGVHLRTSAIGYAACTMASGTSAHAFMTWAHRYIPASTSAPLLLGEPPIVAAGAWVLFGESLTVVEIMGGLAVVAALIGMVRTSTQERIEDTATDPVAPV